jgi:hypothetical protein
MLFKTTREGLDMNPYEPAEEQAALFAEQMRHAMDLLRAELDALRALHTHDRELANHRIAALEASVRDHELRIRADTDGVTQFKMWAGLASGSSGLMALAALIRSFSAHDLFKYVIAREGVFPNRDNLLLVGSTGPPIGREVLFHLG